MARGYPGYRDRKVKEAAPSACTTLPNTAFRSRDAPPNCRDQPLGFRPRGEVLLHWGTEQA